MARSLRTIHPALIGGMPSSGRDMSGHQSAAPETHIWSHAPRAAARAGPFRSRPMRGAIAASLGHRGYPLATAPLDNGLVAPVVRPDLPQSAPYGDEAGAWLQRMDLHRRGTALIFARTETDTFFAGVWEQADALLFFARTIVLPPSQLDGAPGTMPAHHRCFAPTARKMQKSFLRGAVSTAHSSP